VSRYRWVDHQKAKVFLVKVTCKVMDVSTRPTTNGSNES